MNTSALRRAVYAALLTAVIATSAAAQAAAVGPASQQAEALFQSQKWAEAAKAYEALTRAEPSNGRYWYRLGTSLLSLADYGRAVQAFQKAVEISKRAEAMYGLAASYAMMKEKDKAFEWLSKALNAHLAQPEQVERDARLAALRDDPRFKEALALVDKLKNPCGSLPAYRQFDFWVGEWAVTSEGQEVATSSIQRIVNSCIIFENYTQADGYVGKSFNFFDATLKKWRQTWVDGTARVSEFAGVYEDNAMRFEGESHLQDGTRILRRMTLFNLGPDRVRQLSEASTDGGKSWHVTYDFLYSRK